MKLRDSVSAIKGVGEKKKEGLGRLGIKTIRDLLMHYPREYQDRRRVIKISELLREPEGSHVLIRGKVVLKLISGFGRRKNLKLLIEDETSRVEAFFFSAVYMANQIVQDEEYYFYGKIKKSGGKLLLSHPEIIKSFEHSTGILPIYPQTAGLSSKDIQKWIRRVLDEAEDIVDIIPSYVKSNNKLCDYCYAISNIHFPESPQALKVAKYRLIFEEFFYLQLRIMNMKRFTDAGGPGISFSGKEGEIQNFISSLPYELTGAQKRVAGEIDRDMSGAGVMNRLVQGDVGSGKTVIAQMALYKAAKNHYQGAMMAPTELLAKQHFETLSKSFSEHNISCDLLLGSMKPREKKEVLAKLKAGEIDIIVGTHTIIQESVEFKNLGLVITDEQHRFGVRQRKILTEKGANPDILVMTATPIPRTLAVVLYGDLDISVIDELPPNRKSIITKAVGEEKRNEVYEFARSEIEAGRQVYVVAPLISESEKLENIRSAEEIYEELKLRFADFRVDLLHGGMKQEEKDMIMEDFYSGKSSMLVSTVVIEVGINVPNATVMIIENAERFGLAQLHQLRGRVGRGEHKSYCILLANAKTEIAKERMKIMTATGDGFLIAEKDLSLRGTGEFFGLRQHGISDLKLADLQKHINIFKLAQEAVKDIVYGEQNLDDMEQSRLNRALEDYFTDSGEICI